MWGLLDVICAGLDLRRPSCWEHHQVGALESTLAPRHQHQHQHQRGSRCASCSQGRVGMGAGALPHPALRATFPLRAFQGGYFHRIPRRSPLRLVPHSAKDPQVKAAWSAPGLPPPSFWRLCASSKRCLLLPPGPIPGSEPQHLPLHPLPHTHIITFTSPGLLPPVPPLSLAFPLWVCECPPHTLSSRQTQARPH